MIYYTIYTSIPTGTSSKKELEEITRESIAWNAPHDITGILLSTEDRYFQFLEGEEKEVITIFEKIKTDPRHHDVTLRVKGYANERVFSEWSMGSWMLSNKELEQTSGLSDLKDYLNDPVNSSLQSKKFLEMMHNLLQVWISHEPERAKKLKNRDS